MAQTTDYPNFSTAQGQRFVVTTVICWLSMTIASCGSNETTKASGGAPVFNDMSQSAGLVFQHDSGATGEFYMPEIMGAGIALLDFDGDNDLDVYVLQGKPLDPKAESATGVQVGHKLFRNELNPSGSLTFSDVTAKAGIGDTGYGMGVAVGDIDNDGDPDIYLSHYGPNVLYMNQGDGSFRRVEGSGTEDDGFGSSAAFVDYDTDGLLDLYVANYNTFSLSNHQACRNYTGPQDYCDPLAYQPGVDKLYRNLGDGRFADVTAPVGIDEHLGTGLGVVAADFNSDGVVDIYVANDKMANIYWINDGTGGFVNEALMSGTAYSGDGIAEASMGVVAGDVDGDGDDDLFMTHLNGQTNTLYLNDGSGRFRDSTSRMNLGVSSLQYTGFGTIWIDYDNDSDHDLLIANGGVIAQESSEYDRMANYAQRNQFYGNDGAGRFEDLSDVAGPSFKEPRISRGVAVGDIDNDGDLDAVVSNTDGLVELLINNTVSNHHWLSLRLRGVMSNRDGAGARVALLRANGDRIWRRAHTDGSYLSASDIRVHFGLGSDASLSSVGVVWPNGAREQWTDIKVDAQTELVEGTGEPWAE
ncbi:MAG: CRTAC1 family protein [Gammaproteobacteria bacterium]